MSPVYALNLFDLADRDEYLAYARRSPAAVAAHGGRVVALGKFRESVTGDIEPRQVLILVEWESKEAFDSYRDDPDLASSELRTRNQRDADANRCAPFLQRLQRHEPPGHRRCPA